MADAPAIGLPAGVPERPVAQPAYPAVHDMPPARPAALTAAEQIKMEDELVVARNQQQALVGPPPTAPPAAPAAAAPAKPQATAKAVSKKTKPAASKKVQPAQAAPNPSTRGIY